MSLIGCGYIDPQAQLAASLANRAIQDFEQALMAGAQPNLEDERHKSLYETALSTAGCVDFVRACLMHGCRADHVNQHRNKTALSYATDSRDPRILAELLSKCRAHVDRKYGQLTPLHSLATNAKSENLKEVRECMELLLRHGASPNIADQREETPLLLVLRNKKLQEGEKRELARLFLSQPQIDIDTHCDGEVRKLIQRLYPDIALPEAREAGDDGVASYDTLLRLLQSDDETRFTAMFRASRGLELSEHLMLLSEAIKRGKHQALDALLADDININLKAPGQGSSLTEIAIIWGNWRALDKLLKHTKLNLQPGAGLLLHKVISHLEDSTPDDYCDHRRCFELLLANPHVDVNEPDESGQTALHYAVKYRNSRAVSELLRHGAYIGSRSKFDEMPVQDMAAELLEQHLDSCISTNGHKPGDPSFEILIDFKNLRMQAKQSRKSQQDEMTPIAYIAASKELRHLLQHPVISSFLLLKWQRLSPIFYLNFVLYTLFTGCIITYTLLKFHDSSDSQLFGVFSVLSWLGIAYLVLRELIQLLMSAPAQYIFSLTNLLELLLIVLSTVTLSVSSIEPELWRFVAVCNILLVSLEFCLLVGSLPVLVISTHMLMLRAVSSSFIKSFCLYSIFVATFTLCFYLLFGKPYGEPQATTEKPGEEENGSFNSFSNPIEALIKTIVMLTGEFDASSIKFNTFSSYFIFLMFVLFMTIVLFNLLNGLAVSDTQSIKAQAELNGSICRTNTLLRYELALAGRNSIGRLLLAHQPLRSVCHYLISFSPIFQPFRQILVVPNNDNRVTIPLDDSFELKLMNHNSFQALPTSLSSDELKNANAPSSSLLACCCSARRRNCSRLDSGTVKLALAVIDKRCIREQEYERDYKTEQRLQSIELKLEQLLHFIQTDRRQPAPAAHC